MWTFQIRHQNGEVNPSVRTWETQDGARKAAETRQKFLAGMNCPVEIEVGQLFPDGRGGMVFRPKPGLDAGM
jgi:hypothetical protein